MSIEVLGTGHIFQRSVEEVRENIQEKKPDIVALELDRGRFYSLMENFEGKEEKREWLGIVRGGGSFPVLTFLLEKLQKKLGERLGVFPGSEMIQAVKSARGIGSKIVLIDRDIRITMNHFLTIPFKERVRLLKLGGVDWNGKELFLEGSVEDLLKKEVIESVLDEVKKKLPCIYQALVDERDRFMSYNLFHIQKQNPEKRILVVVGAGHRKGILRYLELLEKGKLEDINLKEILEERKTSLFQFFSLTFIIFLTFIIMELGFLRFWKK